jgi:Fe-S cluster assembly protein SufD
MNVQELVAFSDSKLRSAHGPLREFKAHHQELLLKDGLHLDREAYKFTNLNRFFEGLALESKSESLPQFEEDAFIFVDGKLSTSPKIDGLKYGELPVDALKGLITHGPLSHLHHALMGPGLLIEVQKNAEIKEAVRIVKINNQDNISAPLILIKMGPFSKMTLLEETKMARTSSAQISESYVELMDGARLEHIHLDAGSESSLQHGSTWSQIAKDASYTNFVFHLNGKLNRRNLDLCLISPGANGESYALFLTSAEEHSDINTVINHKAADTTSGQIAKGLLDGNSKGVFTGKIHIHPKAQRVASSQLNRNLLLSPKAQIHSRPQLEIFADDVKCSHGSTTGQMSEEEVFYFEARGIPADKARTLLAYGFAMEIVLKIQNMTARAVIENAVMTTLREKFHLGGEA